MTNHPPPLRIAVVGGGPAGFTFASALNSLTKEHEQRSGADRVPWVVTIYEAERSPDARRISGSMNLDRKTGFRAIEAIGVVDRFHEFARPEGQEIRLVNHHGDVVLHYAADATPDDRYSPEIDRAYLNNIVLETLPPDMIKWNHRLSAAHVNGNVYELEFVNGEKVEADVVIGADGAWSRVRALVTDQKPEPPFAGATLLDIKVRDFNSRYPHLVETVGTGTMYSFGKGNMLVAQRNSNEVVHVYLGVKAPLGWRQLELLVEQKDASDRECMITLAKAYYEDWGEKLRSLAMVAAENVSDGTNGDGESTLHAWPMYSMPVGIHWQPRRGVTLVGDAAHVMSPCAGEGVNMAMVDALALAEALAPTLDTPPANHREAVMDAIEAYEREMFKRVEIPARLSADNLVSFFTAPVMTADQVPNLFGPL